MPLLIPGWNVGWRLQKCQQADVTFKLLPIKDVSMVSGVRGGGACGHGHWRDALCQRACRYGEQAGEQRVHEMRRGAASDSVRRRQSQEDILS